MKKVSGPTLVTTAAVVESVLPPQIQEALGELVGAAREWLLALSVGVGLPVVHELMELEVDEVVGPKGKHNASRSAKRHGHEHVTRPPEIGPVVSRVLLPSDGQRGQSERWDRDVAGGIRRSRSGSCGRRPAAGRGPGGGASRKKAAYTRFQALIGFL